MMKKILTILLLISIFGAAADAAPAKMGGPQGIRVTKLWVDGNAVVAGTTTSGATINTGAINYDTTIGANYYLKCAAGTGVFDWSPSSGTFKTSTGTNTIGGATVFAANKGVTVASGTSAFDFSGGSGVFKTSTGAVTIGPGATTLSGATTISQLAAITAGSGSAAYDLSASTGAFTTSTGTNTLSGNTVISGSKTFTTGTGAVALNGDITIAATKGITKTAGAGNFDFSAGTGTFKTSTDTNTLGGNVVISGSKTFTTGTGAVSLNGATTVATSKTLAVTDADKLTVGGVIIPQYWDFNTQISASSVDTNIFIPSSSWQVMGVSEVHTVAGNDAGSVNITLRKCTGTQAPSSGTALLKSVISLKGTANTIAAGSVVTGSGLAKINSTERLALDFSGTLTNLAGGVVTVRLKRI